MQKNILGLLVVIVLFSCDNPTTNKQERTGEPDYYTLSGDDLEMNEAKKTAYQTLNIFTTAFESNNPNYKEFAVKVRFETAKGGEHIWISDLSLEDGDFYGVVNNSPVGTVEVKLGDNIRINKSNISDWMYIDNQKLVGGFTIRVLRDRMSEEEKKQFDLERDYIIED